MANKNGSSGGFSFETVEQSDADRELKQLRSGRGGKTSKYQPIADNAENLKKGQQLRVSGLGRNEVGGVRGLLDRQFPGKYEVASSRDDSTGTFTAFVKLAEKPGA